MKPTASPWAFAGLVGASLLDAVVVATLLGEQDGTWQAPLLGAHGVLAGGCAAMLARATKAASRREAWFVAAAAFSLALFVPALGALALFAAIRASTRAMAVADEGWVYMRVDPDSFRPGASRREGSAASVAATLADRRLESADARFDAILRIADLPPRTGVRLLKTALRDPSEEVRLFAFSRLERMRADLEQALEGFRSALAAAEDDGTREHLRLRLAETHWEFAYLGLAEGAVLDHALDSAIAEATESQRMGRHPAAASFLLGRILLLRRDTEGALAELERASQLGYPLTKLLPYLAECAFVGRTFSRVRSYLEELERASHGHAPLARVREFWQ